MSLPPMSKRDSEQVLRYAFDDTTGRLRVDAVATIGPGGINAADGDNIAISDGVDTMAVNPDGSINTAISGDVQIEISAADGDNIAIASQDGSNYLEVEPDGSINVNVINTSSATVTNIFDEVTGVVSGILTTIVSHTALTNTKLTRATFSGTNIGMYEILINANVQDRQYTYFTNLNGTFNFEPGLDILAGQTITLQVTHFRPTTGDFNGTIQISG